MNPALRVRNKLWLISDTHFGHRNIIKFQQRPETHEIIMLSEWIKAVGEDDQILHLGDVWMKGSPWRWAAILSRLPGRKFLMLGNHDRDKRHWYEDAGFTLVQPFIFQGVAFTHRPITPQFPIWEAETLKGDGVRERLLAGNVPGRDPAHGWHTNIHGHIHGNVLGEVEEHDGSPIRDKRYINVCVEHTDLKPTRLGNVFPVQGGGLVEPETIR